MAQYDIRDRGVADYDIGVNDPAWQERLMPDRIFLGSDGIGDVDERHSIYLQRVMDYKAGATFWMMSGQCVPDAVHAVPFRSLEAAILTAELTFPKFNLQIRRIGSGMGSPQYNMDESPVREK